MTRMQLLLSVMFLCSLGCGTPDATAIVVDNDYPVVSDGGDPSTEMTVYKAWWSVSLLPDPVAPGVEGASERTVLGTDYAYAVLAPGWDPSSSSPPTVLLPAKSAAKLAVARGDVLHVHVSDALFSGNCAAAKPLSQEDADFITQRIFPGEFAGVAFNAATCRSEPLADAGGDGAAPHASDAGSVPALDATSD